MRRLLAAGFALTVLSIAPAHATLTDYTGTTCGLEGAYDEGLQLGNPAIITEARYAVVAGVAAASVQVSCTIKINGATYDTVTSLSGKVAVIAPTPTVHADLPFLDSSDVIQLCTTVRSSSTPTVTSCADVGRTQTPPLLCDLAGCNPDAEEYWEVVPQPL